MEIPEPVRHPAQFADRQKQIAAEYLERAARNFSDVVPMPPPKPSKPSVKPIAAPGDTPAPLYRSESALLPPPPLKRSDMPAPRPESRPPGPPAPVTSGIDPAGDRSPRPKPRQVFDWGFDEGKPRRWRSGRGKSLFTR